LWEPDLPPDQEPNVIGRARFGRITIANSDSAALLTPTSPSIRLTGQLVSF
jgi:hypothetical protein